MIELLNLLSSVEVVEDGRSSFTSSNGNVGLVDLSAPVGGQRARVLLVDGVLVQLALLGVADGAGSDCEKEMVSDPALVSWYESRYIPFSPACAILSAIEGVIVESVRLFTISNNDGLSDQSLAGVRTDIYGGMLGQQGGNRAHKLADSMALPAVPLAAFAMVHTW